MININIQIVCDTCGEKFNYSIEKKYESYEGDDLFFPLEWGFTYSDENIESEIICPKCVKKEMTNAFLAGEDVNVS